MLDKYAYHRMLLCLLEKHERKELIRGSFFDDNNAVVTELDYAELLKAEFYM